MAVARPAVPVLLLALLARSDALAMGGSAARAEQGHGHRNGHSHHHHEAPQREAPQRDAPKREKPQRETPQRGAARRGKGRGHAAQAHARQAQGIHAVQALEGQGASDLGSDHSYDLDENLGEGTDALLDFDVDDKPEDADSLFDMDADTDANGSEPKVNFAPERRMRMHKKAFERDFEIRIELQKDVLATGKALGLKLNLDTDFEPVSIQKIKKKGLVEDFNKAHPRKALHVGDQIIRVNDISWHHNSKTFAQRIKGQWLAARRSMLPTPFMTLYVQRPRRQKDNSTAAQREDLHYQIYASDFTAQLRMPVEPVNNNMAKAMGWQLLHDDDWKPVTIGKIKKSGIVARYNSENPDSKLLVGDEVVEVDKINWHNNATKFMRRLQDKFAKTRNVPEKLRVLNLAIRRPRQVQEQNEEDDRDDKGTVHLVRRLEAAPASHHVGSNVSEPASLSGVGADAGGAELAGGAYGVELYKKAPELPTAKDETQLNHLRRTLVGLATAWNKLHPDDRVDADFKVRGAPAAAAPAPAAPAAPAAASEAAPAPATPAAPPLRLALDNQKTHRKKRLKDLEKLNVVQLKRRLKEAGLLVSGNKAELLARLGSHVDDASRAEVKAEVKTEVKSEVKVEVKQEVKQDINQVKQEPQHDVKEEPEDFHGQPQADLPPDHGVAEAGASGHVEEEVELVKVKVEQQDVAKKLEAPGALKEGAALRLARNRRSYDAHRLANRDVGEAHRPPPVNAEAAIDTDAPFMEAPRTPKIAKKSNMPKEPRKQDDEVGAEDEPRCCPEDVDGDVLGASA